MVLSAQDVLRLLLLLLAVLSLQLIECKVLTELRTTKRAELLSSLLSAPHRSITLARDLKTRYDSDDMKMALDGDRLLRVGKDLGNVAVDGESIGMTLFRGRGGRQFRDAVEKAMRKPVALRQWYLSVIDRLASKGDVWSHSIQGLQWGELDYPVDLDKALKMAAGWLVSKEKRRLAL